MSEEDRNFFKLSLYLNENGQKHEKNVKKFYTKSRIVPLSAIYEEYRNEKKKINDETTEAVEENTIEYLEETLKSFDKYPSNIQKPKKNYQVNRSNSLTLKNSNSLVEDITHEKEASPIDNRSAIKNLHTASEIYSDFKVFMESWHCLEAELKTDSLTKEYNAKLMQLKAFAQNLERQLPGNHIEIKPALNTSQENTLKQLEEYISIINYIQQNKQIFKSSVDNVNNNPRLNTLLNVLTLMLRLISVYKST